MESFFHDPNVERKPPAETRFQNLQSQPNPDGQRVRVMLDITPFQQRPNIELLLTDIENREIASASIIEPMNWKLELTLHIRKKPQYPNADAGSKIESSAQEPQHYFLTASLSYPELGEVDRRQVEIINENH